MNKKKSTNRKKRGDNLFGWICVAPLTIGLLAFLFFPLVFAIVVSFTDYSMYSEYSFFEFRFQFVGLKNYIRVFQNEDFMFGMKNVLINSVGVPIGIIIALLLTNLLVRHPKGSMFFRTLYYLPTVCGSVIITFIWQWIFTMVPQALREGGITINMLQGGNFLVSMIIMGVWSGIGTSVLLLYSSMKGVDKSLYEAAEVDGANSTNKLLHITIPSISPVMFYILFTGVIGSLQEFARFQVMGGNSPSWYKITPVWEIYKQIVNGNDFAYGCAMGIVLGLFIILISIVQFVVSKYWVNYD